MKLSTLTAKLTCGHAKILSTLGALAVAGSALIAAAPAAQAQVAFGVRIGGPRYFAPAPPPVYRPYAYTRGYIGYGYVAPTPGYWDHRRFEDWRAHEYWEQRHDFRGGPVPFRGRAF